MQKSRKKIPLILLVPIVMLVIVVVAGIYRFSIPDEDMLAKIGAKPAEYNLIVEKVLGLRVTKPWTLAVPDANAFAFLDQFDATTGMVEGRYDGGSEKGAVYLPTQWLSPWPETDNYFVAPIIVTSVGSGTFYYVALFKYDTSADRVVMTNSVFLGDRIKLSKMVFDDQRLVVQFMTHSDEQTMADEPNQLRTETLVKNSHRLKKLP